MKIILFSGIFILPAVLLAINFFDDFNSYTPGDDLANSAFWFKADSCGNLTVTSDGGNMIVETVWNSYHFLAYACLGSAVISDGEIEADMKFTGMETSCGLLSRINDSTGESYIGGIYSAYPSIGITVIAYVDANGSYTTLVNDYYYPLNENTWYTVSFEVSGNNPVELSVSVNGTENSTFQDSTYNLSAGLVGLGSAYNGAMPVFYIDNFTVTDYATALSALTFAGIKALFR
ncbi:MAG: hypothetical protein K8S62_07060 [Candidatus Sabulitectum sp.]|nr:hypothetical protein [Candidatus Sabulitectum sp.]